MSVGELQGRDRVSRPLGDEAMNTERDMIAEMREQGGQCAERGGHYRENPFIASGESWQLIVWHQGFLARRVPDPACPHCAGSGLLTLRSVGEPGEYDGTQVQCPC